MGKLMFQVMSIKDHTSGQQQTEVRFKLQENKYKHYIFCLVLIHLYISQLNHFIKVILY